MSQSPKISVIVTCYNYGAYLRSALDSVLHQTVPVADIVVVDDGSTDNTQEVLKDYQAYSQIRSVYQANAGQAAAKNVGLRTAQGDLVAFLDADDWWAPEKIEAQRSLFEKPEVGVVFTRQKFVDPNGEVMAPQPNRLPVFRGRVTPQLLMDNFVPFSSVMFRRSCFERWGGFDESIRMSIDWDLWLRYSAHVEFDYVDQDLLCYRCNHLGQMSKDSQTRLACCELIFDRFLQKNAHTVSPRDVTQAKVYTYNNRAYRLRGSDRKQALHYYLKSLKEQAFQWTAPKGIAKTLFMRGRKK